MKTQQQIEQVRQCYAQCLVPKVDDHWLIQLCDTSPFFSSHMTCSLADGTCRVYDKASNAGTTRAVLRTAPILASTSISPRAKARTCFANLVLSVGKKAKSTST
eukprot:m.153514 g.153514  ORF g.153514 m.153514 type:complete len:104 (+) comp16235_c0_seq2:56-367(+)